MHICIYIYDSFSRGLPDGLCLWVVAWRLHRTRGVDGLHPVEGDVDEAYERDSPAADVQQGVVVEEENPKQNVDCCEGAPWSLTHTASQERVHEARIVVDELLLLLGRAADLEEDNERAGTGSEQPRTNLHDLVDANDDGREAVVDKAAHSAREREAADGAGVSVREKQEENTYMFRIRRSSVGFWVSLSMVDGMRGDEMESERNRRHARLP